MATYEMMVVLDPQRGDEEIGALMGKIDRLITEGGAEITHQDDWGKRRLSHSIDRKVEGHYMLRQFVTKGQALGLVRELERTVRIEEGLLRHLLIRLPKTKKPIPMISRPDPASDARPDWGEARRGWRPPRREGFDPDRRRPPREIESRDSSGDEGSQNQPDKEG